MRNGPNNGSGGRVECRSSCCWRLKAAACEAADRLARWLGGAELSWEKAESVSGRDGRSGFGEPELFLDTSWRSRLVVEIEVAEDLVYRAGLGDGGDDTQLSVRTGWTF